MSRLLTSWFLSGASGYWLSLTGAFLGIAIWETFQPRAELSSSAGRRWRSHGVLYVISVALSAALLRVTPVAVAALAGTRHSGILNKAWSPLWVRCVVAIALLDVMQYGIHWSLHHVPLLWRIHQVHHSDADYDVSTSVRFHPLEVLYSQGVRIGVVAALGMPVAGVAIAEIIGGILNVCEHANASLPTWLESMLRTLIITPDLHRIHHSRESAEQLENLGQMFPWWDRLFRTYAGAVSWGGKAFPTGLQEVAGQDTSSVGFMLAEPFRQAPKTEKVLEDLS